jgi:hypothetical protein
MPCELQKQATAVTEIGKTPDITQPTSEHTGFFVVLQEGEV